MYKRVLVFQGDMGPRGPVGPMGPMVSAYILNIGKRVVVRRRNSRFKMSMIHSCVTRDLLDRKEKLDFLEDL